MKNIWVDGAGKPVAKRIKMLAGTIVSCNQVAGRADVKMDDGRTFNTFIMQYYGYVLPEHLGARVSITYTQDLGQKEPKIYAVKAEVKTLS